MDDIARIVAFGALAAFLVVGTMIGYRIMQDQVLLYIVVIGVLIIMAIGTAGVSFAFLHRFSHTEAELMDAYSANDLTRARRERTRPVPQVQAGGPDLLTAILTGAGQSDVVDGQVTYPDNGGHDDD